MWAPHLLDFLKKNLPINAYNPDREISQFILKPTAYSLRFGQFFDFIRPEYIIDIDEYHASAVAMQETGVFRLPYSTCVFEFQESDGARRVYCLQEISTEFGISRNLPEQLYNSIATSMWIAPNKRTWACLGLFYIIFDKDKKRFGLGRYGKGSDFLADVVKDINFVGENFATLETLAGDLVDTFLYGLVLLATRGVVKERAHQNKIGKLAPRKEPTYTRVRINPNFTGENIGTGTPLDGLRRSPRVHLRRGHVAHVHYGKGNLKIKTIFRAPVLVGLEKGGGDIEHIEYRVRSKGRLG